MSRNRDSTPAIGSATSDIHDALAREVKRLEEDAIYSAKGHFNAADMWQKAHLGLGIGAAILAAVAATVTGTDFPFRDGAITLAALGAAILSAVTTFLNPSDKASAHQLCGSRLNALKNDVRRLREIGIRIDTPAVARQALDQLAARKAEIDEGAAGIPRFAFVRARRGIEAGETTYAVDDQEESS